MIVCCGRWAYVVRLEMRNHWGWILNWWIFYLISYLRACLKLSLGVFGQAGTEKILFPLLTCPVVRLFITANPLGWKKSKQISTFWSIPFCVSLSKGEKAKCGMGSKGVSREGGLIIDNFRESDSDSRDVQVQLFLWGASLRSSVALPQEYLTRNRENWRITRKGALEADSSKYCLLFWCVRNKSRMMSFVREFQVEWMWLLAALEALPVVQYNRESRRNLRETGNLHLG